MDLTDIVHIKRIIVGSNDPTNPRTESQIAEAMKLLNRCLEETPKGRIIAIEKSFSILQVGEHNVILQWMVYHVGFVRRPYWLNEELDSPVGR